MKQAFSIKEALSGARSMISGKMLAIVGIPLLILAVAMALLSVFRLTLLDKTLESRAGMMQSLALDAFPEAGMIEGGYTGADNLYIYAALLDNEHLGTLVAIFDERGYTAIAFDAQGAAFFEKTSLPDGRTRELAFEAIRERAQSLSPPKS